MNEREYRNIVTHYEGYDEDHRFDERWCWIEYQTTLHYIRKYLHPGCKILEVGAGTGRYSLALAGAGYDVTAAELVPHNLAVLRRKVTPDMTIRTMEANALDLSMLADETFDMTLVFGPLYHLFHGEEKRQVLSEALRVTKRGGIVMAAYCITDGPMVNYIFKKHLYHEMVEREVLMGDDWKIHGENGGFLFEHITKGDVDRLMESFPVERLHYVATDGLLSFLMERLEELDDDTFRAAFRYHLSICEREDLVGATAHSLDVFKKL